MFGGTISAGSIVKDYNEKKNSGALNAPESSLTDVDLGKYSQVQNPWRAQLENNSYQQSWWDKLGNWIGFNTKEDSYRLELERLAKEWDSNAQMQNVTDDYNSESSQSARQRLLYAHYCRRSRAGKEPQQGIAYHLRGIAG